MITLNGQPVGRMVYNTDNFRRLQAEVEELHELLNKANAALSIKNAEDSSANKIAQRETQRTKK